MSSVFGYYYNILVNEDKIELTVPFEKCDLFVANWNTLKTCLQKYLSNLISKKPLCSPLSFLLSGFDGFVGWLVLGWTILLGVALRRFYARYANGASTSSL